MRACPMLIALLVLAGCADSRTEVCGNGLRCPLGQECAAAQDVCIEVLGCGDGVISGDEVCDDGNVVSGDGCSADCKTTGLCANGIIDPGEQCGEPGLEDAHCVHLGYDYGHLGCTECRFDDSDCQSFAWTRIPVASQPTLRSIWGSDPDRIFAVGDRRAIIDYNGATWSQSGGLDDLESLHAVFGLGQNDVMAAGEGGTIWRYDGATWSMSRIPGVEATLHGIWGSAAGDVFAVGEGGVIAHYDGVVWSAVEPSPASESLYSVYGSAAGDVFAVGEQGVFHYDGAAWSAPSTPVTEPLYGVFALAADQVVAVGGRGTIARYDGVDWTLASPITLDDLRAVAGTGADHLYAAGDRGTILYYDGATWSALRSVPQAASQAALLGVWSADADTVYAVGENGRLLRHGRDAWQDLAAPPGVLSDLSGYAADDVFAAGAGGTLLHFDGTTWTAPAGSPTSAWLHSVWAGPDGVFAVGEHGAIVRYQPASTTFTLQPAPTSEHLFGVWAGAGAAYAVGANATLLSRENGVWNLVEPSGASGDFADVAGAERAAYIVGQAGLLRFVAGSWQVLYGNEALTSVWIEPSGAVVAVGARGRVVRHENGDTTVVDSSTSHELAALAGTSTGAVYAVGARATMLDCRTRCAPVLAPAGIGDFRSAWSADERTLFLLSDASTVHRLRWPGPTD